MKECVLCKTRYQKGSGVTFHKFPTDNRRLELWLKNINKPSWRPKKYDYICSKHFSDDCFIKHNSCTTLKKCSIPTIFCSSAENVSSTHGNMVLSTPFTSGKRMITPPPSVSKTLAVGVNRTLMMDPNSTNLSGRKRRSTSCDSLLSIASKTVRFENSSSTQEEMVAPTPSVSGTRMVTTTPSVPGSIAVEVKRRLIMEQNDTNLSCRRRRSISCVAQQSIGSKRVRSLSKARDNIKHDHRYENTPKSPRKELQRIKQSLRKSRARVKVLSQHVKRLKINVSSLRTVIIELKKKKN